MIFWCVGDEADITGMVEGVYTLLSISGFWWWSFIPNDRSGTFLAIDFYEFLSWACTKMKPRHQGFPRMGCFMGDLTLRLLPNGQTVLVHQQVERLGWAISITTEILTRCWIRLLLVASSYKWNLGYNSGEQTWDLRVCSAFF